MAENPLFLQVIQLFDEQEFFACHDVLEELWTDSLDDNRQFLQGLIHAAVSLFHFGEGNLGGARKMYESTLRYLGPYQPDYQGLDLTGFLRAYSLCFEELAQPHEAYPAHVALDLSLIPALGDYVRASQSLTEGDHEHT
jgi:predicted metal-dependent hydrolase